MGAGMLWVSRTPLANRYMLNMNKMLNSLNQLYCSTGSINTIGPGSRHIFEEGHHQNGQAV